MLLLDLSTMVNHVDCYVFSDALIAVSNGCSLSKALLEEMYDSEKSQWIVDNRSYFLMDNDPQALIECTQDKDVIVFKTVGAKVPIRPLVISHNLTIVGRTSYVPKKFILRRPLVTFTCAYSRNLMQVT